MTEIRKHYPTKEQVAEEIARRQPPPPKRVYMATGPEAAVKNTVKLADAIKHLISEVLEQHVYISYYYLYSEIFSHLKEKAIEVCSGNKAAAARIIGMKGSTFRESMRSKIRPNQAVSKQYHVLVRQAAPPQVEPEK